jgi:hypothetical protein
MKLSRCDGRFAASGKRQFGIWDFEISEFGFEIRNPQSTIRNLKSPILSPFSWGEREEPGCRARENDPSILAVTGDGPGHERRGIGNLRKRKGDKAKGRRGDWEIR